MNYASSFESREALLQQAKDLRAGKDIPSALAALKQLETLHPNFSRLFQERGHCHAMRRNTRAAIEALQQAVRLNPTLPTSWDMLEQLYRISGDRAQSASAAQNLATLQQLPREVVVANSLFADGDLEPAEQVIRDYLRKDTNNVGALRLLARICDHRGASAEAQSLLQATLERAPDYDEARFDLAAVLLQRQQYENARHHAEQLLAREPRRREYLKQYGAACIGLGDYEPLIELYAKLLEEGAQSADESAELRLWRANALKITGRTKEAIADYHASLAAQPDQAVAWFALANLKTYRFSDDEIARMRTAEARVDIPDLDRTYLCFALGKALEDRAEYEKSWRYYERGNAVRRLSSRYRPEAAQHCADVLKERFTAEFFAARAGWGSQDPAPVFIVGLPRSGSTLIEQILASHSQVEGTHELTEIGSIAADLCGADPDCGLPVDLSSLERLTAADAQALGERYLLETRAYRRTNRSLFVDKMPNNFWHIGLIQLILPRATIIDIRREPMACCFSNFKQLFGGNNQEATYGIEDIAAYYRTYLGLMRHWDRVLPGRVLRVHYENVITDLEGSVRRLLEHCRLPFEPGCVAFHETRRSVRTPSSEQVRRPIAREGVDQWRNYARWLAPLDTALGNALTAYRD